MILLNALLVDEIRKHPSGQVDLIGLYEDLYLERLPTTLENIQIFIDLELETEDKGKKHQIEMNIVTHATKEPVGRPVQIRFDVPEAALFPRNTAQLDLAFFDIIFSHFGRYDIEIRVNNLLQRSLPLYLYPQKENL